MPLRYSMVHTPLTCAPLTPPSFFASHEIESLGISHNPSIHHPSIHHVIVSQSSLSIQPGNRLSRSDGGNGLPPKHPPAASAKSRTTGRGNQSLRFDSP